MQGMDSNSLGVQETDDPLQLPIVNQNENANEVFIPTAPSEPNETKSLFSGNIDSSFYDENYRSKFCGDSQY